MSDIRPLRQFVTDFTSLIDHVGDDEVAVFDRGTPLLSQLLSTDDWLPSAFAAAGTEAYRQYLLHCDPHQRFSIVSFVWGPGQQTPIHDHTVWGMVGVLRGCERCEEFSVDTASGALKAGGKHLMNPGQIDHVSPRVGDIHRVSNAWDEGVSVSIHVYGDNIGTLSRHAWPESGTQQTFVSGYSSELMPNLWLPDAEAAI